jgi:DNA-binding MarR family transcriptional regulator
MASFGITAVQYAALSVVVSSPSLDQNTTAFLAGIDRTTIVGVLSRLVRKGLLKRIVSTADRRVRLLRPTPAGVHLMSRVKKAIERMEERLMEPCSTSESALFCDIMRRLLRERVRSEALALTAHPSSDSGS